MITAIEQAKPGGATDFLAGGGEMGQLIREMDWGQTPLGPIESWSPSLRMMVRFLLANRFPLLLWWGPQFIQIYNDPYRPVLGAKHPHLGLARPVSECWSEIWHILRPLIETPFNGGPATWMEDILLEINRHGFVEETHFTIAYSPAPDETAPGGIGGVLATVHEITEKVVGERRIVALRDLGAQAVEAKTAGEACAAAAAILTKHPLDVPFALLYLIDPDGGRARLAGAAGVAQGDPVSPLVIELGEQAGDRQVWPLAEAVRTETMQTVEDLTGRFGEATPPGPWSDPPRQAVVAPIRSNIAHQLAGLLVVGISSRLRLDDSYRSFIELAANQIATAVANARAYEEERKRAEALAELDRAKTAFFSNVSHEFRTPLTLMLSPLEDTLAEDGLPPRAHERLEVARRNSLRLLKLVNSLLDFSRIEAGRIQASYEPTDLAALTAELASVFRSAIERAGLRLIVNCPPLEEPVYVDREMWEKIVLNLLSNAFKFTFEGEIEVGLRIADGGLRNEEGHGAEQKSAIRHPPSAILTVRDTGTGIPAAELPHVFERFHRVKGARGRTYEGSGIGLALVQELVKLHGGAARVESEVDRGSEFTVTIPCGSAHLPADRIGAARGLASTALRGEAYVEEALRWLPDREWESGRVGEWEKERSIPLSPTPPLSHSRILLADDNADMREYLRRLLGQEYEVVAVNDGAAALRAARERAPDLVLTDVMMPGLDGFGLLRELRADERLKAVPVIMLSARAGEESRIEGLEAGADDYLVKPFSARELLARVESHLKLERLRRQWEGALRASESKFSAAFEQSPMALTITSLDDGRLVEVNEGFVRLSGYTREEALGRTPTELKLWVRPEQHARGLAQLQAGKNIFSVEARFRTKSGEERVGVISASLIEIDSRPYVVSSVADITERKQAEGRLTLLAEISELTRRVEHPNELLFAVARLVGEHLQVRRCLFNEIDLERDLETVHRDYCRGVESVAGVHRVSDYSPAASAQMQAGKTVVNRDSQVDPRTAEFYEQTYAPNGERAYVAVPLMRDGRWVASLWVSDDRPRDWSEQEVGLLEAVAERVWLAVERLRDEQALRESEERFAKAFKASPLCLTISSLVTGKLIEVNETFVNITGYTREEALGRTTVELGVWANLQDREAEMDIVRRLGGIRNAEYAFKRRNGEEIIGRLSAERIEIGGEPCALTVIEDITERKRAEQALREADRRKDEFLAMLAHELRNPLAPICNATHVLKLIGPADANQQWAREVIERQTAQLTRLVDDLLDVSRITQGKVTLRREPLDLATVINRAVETSRPLIDAHRHQLTVALPSEPARVEGDLARLVQIVSNLLNNAAKYTDEGGHIRLEAGREDGAAVIRVRDDGMGIPADLLPHVFDLFTQAERSLDRSQGGLGIGLTLVRNLVEMHGGKVEARSDGPGRGSEFVVRLPIITSEVSPDVGTASDELARQTSHALRVLVVEDNLDSADMMNFMLKLGGHEVRTAHDGPAALEAIRAFQPQVVLCDIGLPGMNGYEIAGRLRAAPEFAQTLLIALTGYGQEEARRRAKEAGFDYHLVKPVKPDALNALLDSLTQRPGDQF